MKDFWNERYSASEYVYGTEPNAFFKAKLAEYHPTGKILLPGDGEGRNSVYAARQGLEVTAFDLSEEGRRKALKLAKERGVSIDYRVGEFSKLNFEKETFDAAALIFAHFPPDKRAEYHKAVASYLKPGGLLILEGYSKAHTKFQAENPQAGGPPNPGMLFSKEQVRDDFKDLEVLELEETEVELTEGIFHKGKGAVIRFVGSSPSDPSKGSDG